MQTTTIDSLPVAQELSDSNRFPVNQAGVTRRVGLGAVKDYIQADVIAGLEKETEDRIQGDTDTLNSAKSYTDQKILGGNEWLPPQMTTAALLQITGLDPSRNYLCKVVADPVQSGVYQAVAGWTTTPNWALYNTAVDLVSEPEMAQAINTHNEDETAHEDIREKIRTDIDTHDTDAAAHYDIRHDISEIETDVSNLDNDLSELDGAVTGINQDLQDTKGDLENTKGALWGTDDGNGNLTGGRIPALESGLAAANEQIDGAQTIQLTGAFLTRVINGLSVIAKSLFDPSAIFIAGKTQVNDENGTMGVYTRDIDSANIEIRTTTNTTISANEPALIGSVSTHAELPPTIDDAELLGWQTPRIGDYARVEVDETLNNKTIEWTITNIDVNGNITWASPVLINTGDYQVQTSAQDSGRVLTGGASAGTFGESLGIDMEPTAESPNLISSGAVAEAIGAVIYEEAFSAMQDIIADVFYNKPLGYSKKIIFTTGNSVQISDFDLMDISGCEILLDCFLYPHGSFPDLMVSIKMRTHNLPSHVIRSFKAVYNISETMYVQPWEEDGLGNSIDSGTVATVAETAAKIATIENFDYSKSDGKLLVLQITAGNTATSTLSLNVNNQGARNIWFRGTVTGANNRWLLPANSFVFLQYDAVNSRFNVIDNGDTPAVWFGAVTATAVGTAAKVVTGFPADFTYGAASDGRMFTIRFTSGNTAASMTINPTPAGGSALGAKPFWIRNAVNTIANGVAFFTNQQILVRYVWNNGTDRFEMVEDPNGITLTNASGNNTTAAPLVVGGTRAIGTSMVRNIIASTSDPGVNSSLTQGDIRLVYV